MINKKINKKTILTIFFMAFKDILRPRIASVIILPFLASALLWGIVTYFLMGWLTTLGVSFYETSFVQSVVTFLSSYFTITDAPFITFTKSFFIFAVIIPLSVITALLVTSILLVPVVVEEIRKTDFPSLIKKSNSIFAGTTASLSLSAKYLFSWVGTLPLWLIIPGGNIIIPFLLLSWFNSRLFTWEVMVEVADEGNTKLFLKKHSKELWGLGFLTSLLYFVPVLNFIAPVITAACFSRFCLSRIQAAKKVDYDG